MTIQCADFSNVFIKVISIHISICYTLVEVGGVEISALFDFDEFAENIFVSSYPTKTQTGAEYFGESAKEHYQTFGVQRFQGRQDFAFKTQFAVRIIFQYRQVVFINNFHKFLTAFHRPGTTSRVLEVRNYIDKFAVGSGFQNFVQFFRQQTAIIGRNFYEGGFISVESVECAQIRGAFAQNNVARVQEQFASKVEALLGTSGNQNFIGVNIGVVFISHTFRNFSTQGRTTFGSCVLQQLATFLQNQVMGNFSNFFNGEQFRCRQTTSKGNDVRLSS